MDDKGFSLIELLVAVAISTMIIASVGQAMVLGMRHYSAANTEATMQERAQIAMNILQDEIIDCTALPVFGSMDGKKTLEIYHGLNGVKKSQVYLDHYDSEAGQYDLLYKVVEDGAEPELLASGIVDFKCTIDDEKASVIVEIEFKEGKRGYKASNSIFMRNFESFTSE